MNYVLIMIAGAIAGLATPGIKSWRFWVASMAVIIAYVAGQLK